VLPGGFSGLQVGSYCTCWDFYGI